MSCCGRTGSSGQNGPTPRRSQPEQLLALLFSALLVFPPASWAATDPPAVAGAPSIGLVVRGVQAALNDIPAAPGTTVFSGDQISTGRQGWVLVLLGNGDYFSLGDGVTEALVRRASERDLFVSLRIGVLTIASPHEALFRVETPCGTAVPLVPRDAMWQVVVRDAHTVEIAAYRSTLNMDLGSSQLTVEPRERYLVECGVPGAAPRATWIGLAALGAAGGALAIILTQLDEGDTSPAPVSPSGFP
jgi:hypothetical protein